MVGMEINFDNNQFILIIRWSVQHQHEERSYYWSYQEKTAAAKYHSFVREEMPLQFTPRSNERNLGLWKTQRHSIVPAVVGAVDSFWNICKATRQLFSLLKIEREINFVKILGRSKMSFAAEMTFGQFLRLNDWWNIYFPISFYFIFLSCRSTAIVICC